MIYLCSKKSNNTFTLNLKMYFLMSEDGKFISHVMSNLEYLVRNTDNGSIRNRNNQFNYEIIAQYKDVRDLTEKYILDFPETCIWLGYVSIMIIMWI